MKRPYGPVTLNHHIKLILRLWKTLCSSSTCPMWQIVRITWVSYCIQWKSYRWATASLYHMQPQFKSFKWRKKYIKYLCKFFHWQIIFSTDICLLFYSILAFKYCFGCWNEEHEQVYFVIKTLSSGKTICSIIFLSSLIGYKTCISLELSWLFLKFWVSTSSLNY